MPTKPTKPAKPARPAKPTEPVLSFGGADEWRRWLTKHHATSGGVLLRLGKKGAAKTVTYAEAVEVALCWGWIDGHKRALDAEAWLQRFTRRTATSQWSKINCAKVEALIAGGAMQPPGLREIERAKADGRWERAYDGARTATLPEDLAAALQAIPGARAFFDALDGTNRYAILYRVQTAKKPETRTRRVAELVAMCGRRETLHPVRVARKPKQK